jgi:acyl-coenzyme A synthetase/AMP-(fatty) acid ligase
VLHNHHAALGQGYAFVESLNLNAGDRLCCFTFFPHALVLGTLMTGAALHIVDRMSEGLRAIAARLRQDRVTVLSSFPSMLRSLSVVLLPGGRLADLRTITFSGEPITASDINLALRLMPEGGIATNNYGSSEFVMIASHSVRGALPDSDVVPSGRPLSGVEVRLVDARGDPVPNGETGEITVRAPFMSSGYWKNPDLTREIFGSATPQDGKTYYHTGDVGLVDSTGIITVLGREDNQIKLRAHRITPEEIEAVLLRHPTIAAAAVRAFTDEQGRSSLVAYLVSAPDAVVEPAVLRAFAQRHLPTYMVPSAFLPIEALPQTVGGKLDRAALPHPLPLTRASQRR